MEEMSDPDTGKIIKEYLSKEFAEREGFLGEDFHDYVSDEIASWIYGNSEMKRFWEKKVKPGRSLYSAVMEELGERRQLYSGEKWNKIESDIPDEFLTNTSKIGFHGPDSRLNDRYLALRFMEMLESNDYELGAQLETGDDDNPDSVKLRFPNGTGIGYDENGMFGFFEGSLDEVEDRLELLKMFKQESQTPVTSTNGKDPAWSDRGPEGEFESWDGALNLSEDSFYAEIRRTDRQFIDLASNLAGN